MYTGIGMSISPSRGQLIFTLVGQLFLLRDQGHQRFITVSTGIRKGKMPANIKGEPAPFRAFSIRTKYSLKRLAR